VAVKKGRERTAAKKRRIAVQLTRRGIALWACLIVLISAWMFVLGILVGRETRPLKFDINQLEKKLAALKADDLKKELQRYRIYKDSNESKSEFGFYEALKLNRREDIQLPKEGTRKKSTLQVPKSKRAAKSKNTITRVPSAADRRNRSLKRLTVQVASVKNMDDAGRMIAKLKKKGFAAYMTTARIPGKGTWYRVRIGSFQTKSEALDVINKLKKEKFTGSYIIKE